MNFVPTRPIPEILEEVAGVWSYLYEPERFLKRAARYYVQMRPTRAALGMRNPASDPSVPSAKVPLKKKLSAVSIHNLTPSEKIVEILPFAEYLRKSRCSAVLLDEMDD